MPKMSINERIKNAFWRIDDGAEMVYHRAIKPFEHELINYSEPLVCEAIKHHNNQWLHTELVVKANNGTVEPQYAYAVDGLRTIIGASIRTRNNLPSPISVLKSQFLGQRSNLKKAILFDGSMGWNYMHFFSDVLHKIYLLERFTELDCPILVGPSVFDRPMMRYIRNESPLKNLEWVRLEKPVQAEELWIARPMPYEPLYFQRTKEFLISEDLRREKERAIFLNRIGTSRCILNIDEILKILSRYDIEVLATEKLTMKQQAEILNLSSRIIGIHGAAFTNLMYCNYSDTKVLELCSSNRIGTQFYWLCTALGIKWDMMLGSEADANQSFELDPNAFEKRLQEFMW